MPRAEHGHGALTGGAGDLVTKIVDLADRLLQVLLVDLVGRHRHVSVDLFLG
jgi:hypothetical protein